MNVFVSRIEDRRLIIDVFDTDVASSIVIVCNIFLMGPSHTFVINTVSLH